MLGEPRGQIREGLVARLDGAVEADPGVDVVKIGKARVLPGGLDLGDERGEGLADVVWTRGRPTHKKPRRASECRLATTPPVRKVGGGATCGPRPCTSVASAKRDEKVERRRTKDAAAIYPRPRAPLMWPQNARSHQPEPSEAHIGKALSRSET